MTIRRPYLRDRLHEVRQRKCRRFRRLARFRYKRAGYLNQGPLISLTRYKPYPYLCLLCVRLLKPARERLRDVRQRNLLRAKGYRHAKRRIFSKFRYYVRYDGVRWRLIDLAFRAVMLAGPDYRRIYWR